MQFKLFNNIISPDIDWAACAENWLKVDKAKLREEGKFRSWLASDQNVSSEKPEKNRKKFRYPILHTTVKTFLWKSKQTFYYRIIPVHFF
jgi:hypothetical protein